MCAIPTLSPKEWVFHVALPNEVDKFTFEACVMVGLLGDQWYHQGFGGKFSSNSKNFGCQFLVTSLGD
jgi:hypothetical protein